ncbi:MAG: hypothetical protein R3284_07375, partial [Rubricoccaceae bacterium]|nr:hypothetical protein [Rubricoccaceae bacterium]
MPDALHSQPDGSALQPLDCCVERTDGFAPKAKYAMEMLLLGLGLKPNWVDNHQLENTGICYGRGPVSPGQGILNLSLADSTERYFSERLPMDLDQISWLDSDGTRWPVLFRTSADENPD